MELVDESHFIASFPSLREIHKVWDVVSNEKAVEIVASATERDESAKRLVDYAAGQWKLKRPGYAVDDISVVCMFFHNQEADPEISSSGDTHNETRWWHH